MAAAYFPPAQNDLTVPLTPTAATEAVRHQRVGARLRSVLLAALAWLLSGAAAASEAYHYTFTPEAEAAYAAIIELRLAEGRGALAAQRRADPTNLVPVWLEDYADFFEVYITEDAQVFARLEEAYRDRLELLRAGPEDSPYHRYAQANVMLHWALARLKFGEYVTTFREARRAYKLLTENLAAHPDFALTRKELGVLQAAVATVPDGYQWGVEFVTGMDGDLEAGKRHIEAVLAEQRRTGSPFLQETTAVYAFLLLNLAGDEEGAWARIRDAGFDPERSLLGVFVLANIAMRTGRNDEAIRLLSRKPHSPRYFPFPYLDFMMGVAQQRRLESGATVYLRSFVERKRSGNFIREAHQKLAWQAALRGDRAGYFAELDRLRAGGADVVGSDRNALREAEARTFPNLGLLRARLLFDGGYYARAAEALADVDASGLTAEQRIELPYRRGRVAAARGQREAAERAYKQTVSIGRDAPAYYACKAAVELGNLAAQAGERDAARAYYELALEMRPAEYGPGLHQQAKAGLARLKRGPGVARG